METHVTSQKTRTKGWKQLITATMKRWAASYIQSMSKALYPPETKGVQSKNDRHRSFYK
ncbi:hypothetical protein [Aquimarina spongiae]|uniref:Uncharacterized protein n=1 Tax=Aquimarina spongiae TaxID=570521 RepID=A0A1M6JLL7_9FLAO|nr:hypothetical protein [Aquimarina spongiae]SHJ47514.1 hypothetical protein SAMN04488508_109130 [Aquimarina spongiae]